MKKGLFCIVMLFCICVAMNAQGLKTYSGFYKAKNMNLFGTPKATYTYKNAEDGTRIYEGNFTYTCVTKPNIYDKVTGRFHDDCKEGLWTFTDKSPTESKVLKINYSEGYRSGTYEYTYISKGAIKESLKTTMKEGVMVGPVSGHLTSYNFHIYDYGVASSRGVIGKGTFNGQTDEKGLADGLWKLIMKNEKDNKTMLTFYDKWEHGVVKESYYIDDSTGDKIECATHETWGIPSVIFDLAHTPCSMENWIERGSDKPWQGILLHPSDIEEREGNKIYDCTIASPIAESPSFPGGENALKQYLNSNIQCSREARLSGKRREIGVKFIVEKDGSINDAEISYSADHSLDQEALKIVQNMPKWNPGKLSGNVVRTKTQIEIVFRIK